MPTYQYTCTDCAEPIEAVQKFTDAPLTVCVSCGGRLRKVFSPVGIVFKGSGFYRTDSRNGSTAVKEKTSAESTPASGSGSGNGSGAAKSEPAKKAEPARSSSSTEKAA